MKKLAVLSCIVGLVAASTQSFAAVRVVRFVNGRKIIETIDQEAAWARRVAKRSAPQKVKPRKLASVPAGYYRNRVAKPNIARALSQELHYVRPKTSQPASQATPRSAVVTQRVEQSITKADAARTAQPKTPLAFTELQKTSMQAAQNEIASAKELGTQVIKNSTGDVAAFGVLDAWGNVLYAERLDSKLMSDVEFHWLFTNRLNFVILSARKNHPTAVTLVVDKMEAAATSGTERYPAFLETSGVMKRNVREYVYTLRDGKFIEMREEDPALNTNQDFLLDKTSSVPVVTVQDLLEQNQWPYPYL